MIMEQEQYDGGSWEWYRHGNERYYNGSCNEMIMELEWYDGGWQKWYDDGWWEQYYCDGIRIVMMLGMV